MSEILDHLSLADMLNGLIDEPYLMTVGGSEALMKGLTTTCHFNEYQGLIFSGKRGYNRVHQLNSLLNPLFKITSGQEVKDIIERPLQSYMVSSLSQRFMVWEGEVLNIQISYQNKPIFSHSNPLGHKSEDKLVYVNNFNRKIWDSCKVKKENEYLEFKVWLTNPSVFRLGFLEMLKAEPDFFLKKIAKENGQFSTSELANLVRPNSFFGLFCRYLAKGTPRISGTHEPGNILFQFNDDVIKEINSLHNNLKIIGNGKLPVNED